MSLFYQNETEGAALSPIKKDNPTEFRNRILTRWDREDLNKVFHFDFMGTDIMTGFMKHIFQLGFDWKESEVTTTSYHAKNVDQINVLNKINNILPVGINIDLSTANSVNATTPTIGLMAQDVITLINILKLILVFVIAD